MSLVEKAFRFLNKSISLDNACTLLEYTHIFEDKAMRQRMLGYIHRNAYQVLATESFHNLCPKCLGDVLKSDDLDVEEHQVLEAAYSWAQCEAKRLEKDHRSPKILRELLGQNFYYVRFPLIAIPLVTMRVAPYTMLTVKEVKALNDASYGIIQKLPEQFNRKRRNFQRLGIKLHVEQKNANAYKVPQFSQSSTQHHSHMNGDSLSPEKNHLDVGNPERKPTLKSPLGISTSSTKSSLKVSISDNENSPRSPRRNGPMESVMSCDTFLPLTPVSLMSTPSPTPGKPSIQKLGKGCFTVNRFKTASGPFDMSNGDSVTFRTSEFLLLRGIQLFGAYGTFDSYKIYITVSDENQIILSEKKFFHDDYRKPKMYDFMFAMPVPVYSNADFVVRVKMIGFQGKPTYIGRYGKRQCVQDGITFEFGTKNTEDYVSGQIPGLICQKTINRRL